MPVMETLMNALPAFNPVHPEEAALRKVMERRSQTEAEIRELKSASIDEGDFDQVIARSERLHALNRILAAADHAVKTQEGRLSDKRAKNEKVRELRKNEVMRKTAEVDKKRFRAIFTSIEKLQAELTWAADHVAEYERYNRNERPADLPLVLDAEALLRYRAGTKIPEKFEEIDVWRDAQGREPTQFRMVNGERVPVGIEAYTKSKERVCIQTARTVPGGMPERLADAIRLIDIEGKPIWPPQASASAGMVLGKVR